MKKKNLAKKLDLIVIQLLIPFSSVFQDHVEVIICLCLNCEYLLISHEHGVFDLPIELAISFVTRAYLIYNGTYVCLGR